MADLREQLARRLSWVNASRLPAIIREQLYGTGDSINWDRVQLTSQELALADECLRQMEWARRQALSDPDFDASQSDWMTWVQYNGDRDLTLAPEDWKSE